MNPFKFVAVVVVSLASIVPVTSYAAGRHPAAALPPLGFQLFCLKNPQQCRASGRSSVRASGDVMAMLRQVNGEVNRSIRPQLEAGDTWNVDPSSGDCHDFAITKRSHLIGMGMPASALRIAFVKTSWGDNHAVLVVRTSQQELVLDNLTNEILPIQNTGLRVISVAGANPLQWERG